MKKARKHRRRRWVEVRFHLSLIALLVAGTGTALGLVPAAARLAGWKTTTVVSGSMSPAVNVGEIVVAEPPSEDKLVPGRVVVFRNPAGPGLVTHRLLVRAPDGTWRTKGDANREPDSTPLHPDAVVGVARVVVPGAGLPVVWFQSGRLLQLAFGLVLFGMACWASRFALLDRFDPWRPIRTSYLLNGVWVMPEPEPHLALLPFLPRIWRR